MFAPAGVVAQPVLGPGDDATLPAPGQSRVRVQLGFGTASERAGGVTGGGTGRAPLASEYSVDSLGVAQLPGLTALRDAVRTLTGASGLSLSLGTVQVYSRVSTTVAPVVVEYGLTRRFGLSVTIPYVRTRTLVNVDANPGGGTGNFGVNPAAGDDALATAARAQNVTAVQNLAGAVAAIAARCPSSDATSTCVGARTLSAELARVQTGITAVYGDGTTDETGALAVPLAGSDAQTAVAARIAALGAQYTALGISGYTFNAGAVPAPSRARYGAGAVRELINTAGLGLGGGGEIEPFEPVERASIGDVEAAASFMFLDTFGDTRDGGVRARVVPGRGLRVRSTLTGGFRFPTGGAEPSPLLVYNEVPTERAAAILVRSATDLAFGRRASLTVVGRLAAPLADRRTLRIPLAPGQPFSPTFAVRPVDRKLGRDLQLELTPRYATGEAFAVVGHALLRDRGAAEYAGTYTLTADETGGDPVTLDAAALGVGSGGREARVGLGAAYSTLAAWSRGRSRLPVEVSYLHSTTAAASNGAVPYTSTDQLTVRVYARLFGR